MSINREQPSYGTSRLSKENGETILLVEDEASVRILVVRFLTLHGFRVLAAEDGRRALSLWAEHKHEIDLLLTDVVMPGGWSGRALTAEFRAERSDLKVLHTSGYSAEALNVDGNLSDEINFLQKPYRPEQLLATVRAVLAGTFNYHAESLC
jgi:two-component system, cell cycle sensor histidine kinase and response regulator CckA